MCRFPARSGILIISLIYVLASTPSASGTNISAWLDHASFRYPADTSRAIVEFYYSVPRHQLTFAFVDTGYAASADIWIEILGEDGESTDTLFKRIATYVSRAREITDSRFRLADQMGTLLPPGQYTARLQIQDVESRTEGVPESGKVGQVMMEFEVPELNSTRLILSGIELSYQIEMLPIDTDTSNYGPIEKSNRRIIPNPSRVFVDTDTMIYFYSEVYNLEYGEDSDQEFYVGCKLLDVEGTEVSNFGRRTYLKPGRSAIVSSAIDVADLNEGNYILELHVSDGANGDSTSSFKSFHLFKISDTGPASTSALTFTREDAEFLEKLLTYAFTADERRMLDQLNLEGKRKFFDDYWKRNDPDPTTEINEFKVEMLRRFNYANEHFSVSIAKKDDGWRTDRGRVYIVYGPPSDIEDFQSTEDLKPFQKWNYNSLPGQGARFFIFQDETGYGDYRLAHSDAQGEPYDPKWQQLIEQKRLNEF
jgi:GWxTD domain-containing protein